MTKVVALTLLAFTVAACAAEGVLGGMLLGGLLEGPQGDALDKADRQYAARSAQHTLESAPIGTTGKWENPDSGHYGTITPTRTYPTPSGRYCREFHQTISVGDSTEEAYGTACQQPDGSWQILQ